MLLLIEARKFVSLPAILLTGWSQLLEDDGDFQVLNKDMLTVTPLSK